MSSTAHQAQCLGGFPGPWIAIDYVFGPYGMSMVWAMIAVSTVLAVFSIAMTALYECAKIVARCATKGSLTFEFYGFEIDISKKTDPRNESIFPAAGDDSTAKGDPKPTLDARDGKCEKKGEPVFGWIVAFFVDYAVNWWRAIEEVALKIYGWSAGLARTSYAWATKDESEYRRLLKNKLVASVYKEKIEALIGLFDKRGTLGNDNLATEIFELKRKWIEETPEYYTGDEPWARINEKCGHQ